MNEVEVSSRLDPIGHAGGFPVVNGSPLSDTLIVGSQPINEVAAQLSRWVDRARGASSQGLFDRGFYTPPDNPFDEMTAALTSVENDDIVGGVAEVTEAFAFQGVKWEGHDPDEADIFNQISRDIDLDAVIRAMWQQLYAVSQFVVATRWGWKEYTVRGKTENGQKRKKRYYLYVPVAVHVIDSRKVIPVGHTALGPQGLAWNGTNQERDHWYAVKRREAYDPVMEQFFIGHYTPPKEEEGELNALGVDTKNLLVMNPDLVWRHTLTKPDYERFAPVRLKSVFRHLDLKQQLMNSDRAMLIGAANYILLIRKGSETYPAKSEELQNLKENYNFIAKLPVIISDHRMEVDIIAPKTDFVLQSERYNMLDQRILTRLLGTLSIGNSGQRNETNVTLSRAVARNMENRRHMLKRSLEKEFARRIYEHPFNATKFDGGEEPNLTYTPRNVALDIDAAMVQAIVGLRTQRELSRETILEHFGFDQDVEAQRREIEEERYDHIFKTHTPFDSPEGDPNMTGRQGGRPVGGGSSSGDATTPRTQTEGGNPSTTASEEGTEDDE